MPTRWRRFDTWPVWAWVVVLIIEATIALLGLKYGN